MTATKSKRRYRKELGFALAGAFLGAGTVWFLAVALSDPLSDPITIEAEILAIFFGAFIGACSGACIAS